MRRSIQDWWQNIVTIARTAPTEPVEFIWGLFSAGWGLNTLWLLFNTNLPAYLGLLLLPVPVLAVLMVVFGSLRIVAVGVKGDLSLKLRSLAALLSPLYWGSIFLSLLIGTGGATGVPVYLILALVPFWILWRDFKALGKAARHG